MKTRIITGILLVAFVLGGCSNAQVLPGIYLSDDPADFPFPTSGYTVYLVGETHGNNETKWVFQTYLKILYQKADLRDIVLEEDQAYTSDASAYVQGLSDELPGGLCLRTDILGQIREFNASLPANEKVNVHLVDVDSPFPLIYKHLMELYAQMGPEARSVQVPPVSELKTWTAGPIYDLMDELQKVAPDQPDIVNGLETIDRSFHWYFWGNDMDTGRGVRKNFFPPREDVITQNLQHLVTQLNGKPILAFFGFEHGQKLAADLNPPSKDMKSWAQRLSESGIPVYALSIWGMSGEGYWRGDSFIYGKPPLADEFLLEDGTNLVSIFATHPDATILYADLREQENTTMQLPTSIYMDIPAGQVFDGLVIFKRFTPMENACLP